MRVVGLRIGLSLLAGALLFLAVPTYGLWPLMWIAAVPEIYVARVAATPKRAFLYGWLTGAVAHTGGFYWMDGLLERFGHMAPIEALPIMALLIAYQGLAFAFFSWGVRRAWDRTGAPLVLLAPLVMVAVELLMPQIFPYYLAISQAFVPAVIQIADVTGPLGVTALMLAFAGAAADLVFSPPPARRNWPAWRGMAIVGVLIAADLGYGALRIHQADARRAAAPKVRTGLVQANVGILEKWDPEEFARLLVLHQRASADLQRAGAELVVWPESSYPYALPRTFAHDFGSDDGRMVRRGFDTSLMFGAVTRVEGAPDRAPRKGPDRYPYNTAIMMDAAGNATGSYDKVFLMMFGEYVPFYDQIPWFTEIFPEASNFSRGSEPGSFPLHTAAGDFKLGPLICYEDILPSFARRVAKLGPNAFVNITNDAWFQRAPRRRGARSSGDRVGRSRRAANGAAEDAAGRPGDASRRRPLPDGGRPVRVSLPAVAGRPPGLEGRGTLHRAAAGRRPGEGRPDLDRLNGSVAAHDVAQHQRAGGVELLVAGVKPGADLLHDVVDGGLGELFGAAIGGQLLVGHRLRLPRTAAGGVLVPGRRAIDESRRRRLRDQDLAGAAVVDARAHQLERDAGRHPDGEVRALGLGLEQELGAQERLLHLGPVLGRREVVEGDRALRDRYARRQRRRRLVGRRQRDEARLAVAADRHRLAAGDAAGQRQVIALGGAVVAGDLDRRRIVRLGEEGLLRQPLAQIGRGRAAARAIELAHLAAARVDERRQQGPHVLGPHGAVRARLEGVRFFRGLGRALGAHRRHHRGERPQRDRERQQPASGPCSGVPVAHRPDYR
jgi:apolipoprotein N-acyltransferase